MSRDMAVTGADDEERILMLNTPFMRFFMLGSLMSVCVFVAANALDAEDPPRSREGLKEPVFRVSKTRIEPNEEKPAHPLDPALKIAYDALARIRTQVDDYSCTLIKQERINGVLNPEEYMFAEIRNRKVKDSVIVTPLSVYLYFLKPGKIKGREVIFIEGQNNGKMVAHEGGILRIAPAVWLKPTGPIAMRGQLYPITDIGIETLVDKLIEKGERDLHRGECAVEFIKGAKINGRVCTVLQVKHPTPRPWFDFHIARIFIDDQLQIPIRYAAYTWPKEQGGKPRLLEAYTYLNLKLNVQLTNAD
ncbi:MAG: DUF1571 domain-containing protein, partial [Pirellulaceae bacterium]|nr:DUF1571 domain-containing protein [Pirellulaceae bacterium]